MVHGILADIDDILKFIANVHVPGKFESDFFLRVTLEGIYLIPGCALQRSPGSAVCVVAGSILPPYKLPLDCRWCSLCSGWRRMPGPSQKSPPGLGALLLFLASCDGHPSMW